MMQPHPPNTAVPSRPIESLSLRGGPPEQPFIREVPISNTLLVVGPNNSGKSLLLRELFALITNPPSKNGRLVDSFGIHWPSAAPIVTQMLENSDDYNIRHLSDNRLTLISQVDRQYCAGTTYAEIEEIATSRNPDSFTKTILRPCSALYTGMNRSSVLKHSDIPGGRARGPLLDETSVVSHLFRNRATLDRASDDLYNAFGLNCAIDYTNSSDVRFRFSRNAIPDVIKRSELTPQALSLFKKMMGAGQVSDGVISYLSLIVILNAQRQLVLMLDEPEVFLFPALIRRFGAYATKIAEERSMNLILSTHSPDLLLGCLDQSEHISIVRLGYNFEYGDVFTVGAEELRSFLRRPLVRSANALSALFAHGAVVTEGHNDRAVYEIMFQKNGVGGFQRESIQLINARNKDTVAEIVGPLRAFGVPAAAVVDIDVLNQKHVWKELVRVAGMPEDLIEGLLVQRNKIWSKIQETGVDVKKEGIDKLPDGIGKGVGEIIDQAKSYGLFIVPVGELEGWLREIPRLSNKTDWATKAIEHLYGAPSTGSGTDWGRFCNDISAWIRDGERKGMPSIPSHG